MESIENKRPCFGISDVPKRVTSPNGENKPKLTGPFGVCCRVPVGVARFSYRFFTAMAGNKAEKKNQGSSMYFYALS